MRPRLRGSITISGSSGNADPWTDGAALRDQIGLHAPRQVGKTTALLALAAELTTAGRYVAVLVSMEVGAPFGDDPGVAENAILSSWRSAALAQLPDDLQPPTWPRAEAGRRIGGALDIANPIYREVIPRVLAGGLVASLGMVQPTWLRDDGRIDILLRYGPDRFAFELKIWREGRPDLLAGGLAQLDAYLSLLGLGTGWLVIFDRREQQPPLEERTSGRRVTVVRA